MVLFNQKYLESFLIVYMSVDVNNVVVRYLQYLLSIGFFKRFEDVGMNKLYLLSFRVVCQENILNIKCVVKFLFKQSYLYEFEISLMVFFIIYLVVG